MHQTNGGPECVASRTSLVQDSTVEAAPHEPDKRSSPLPIHPTF